MSAFTPEFKEWFTTAEGSILEPYIPGEDTPVEQSNPPFLKSAYIDGVLVDLIFVENGEPTEPIWKKLFSSLTFKLNNSDRALLLANSLTTTGDVKAGLVVLADDSSIKTRDNGLEDDYSLVVRPSGLPEVLAVDSLETPTWSGFNTFWENNSPAEQVEVLIDPLEARRDIYQVRLTESYNLWLADVLEELQQYTDRKPTLVELDIINGIGPTYATSSSNITTTAIPKVVGSSKNTSIAAANKFTINLQMEEINPGGSFSAVETGEIASKAAVYQHVETRFATLDAYAPLADFIVLNSSVMDPNGIFDRLAVVEADYMPSSTIQATYMPKTGGTFTGSVTFASTRPTLTLASPAIAASDALAKQDLDTFALTVYTKAEVDALVDPLELRIITLEGQVVALTNALSVLTGRVTTLEGQMGTKADANHTHSNLVSVPATVVADGSYTLTRVSRIEVVNGIISNITT